MNHSKLNHKKLMRVNFLMGYPLNKKLPQFFAFAKCWEVITLNQLKHFVGFSGKEFYYSDNDSAANKIILVSVF